MITTAYLKINFPMPQKMLFPLMLPLYYLLLKSAYQGAQTSIHCAVCEEMEGVSGKYLADCKVTKTLNPQATQSTR